MPAAHREDVQTQGPGATVDGCQACPGCHASVGGEETQPRWEGAG